MRDATKTSSSSIPWKRLASEYGMVVVLMLLVGLFSLLTIAEQHPTGTDAAKQVVSLVIEQSGQDAGVLIVTRDTEDDRRYGRSISEQLTQQDMMVHAVVHGSPADARKAIETILDAGGQIDAIATNDAVSKWPVFDVFEEAGRDKLIVPEPYHWPNFLKLDNLISVADQTAIYAIIAIGLTMVIITAGIDLSVGSLIALASVVGTLLIRDLGGGAEAGLGITLGGIAAGVGVCALAGLFCGSLVTGFRIPAFIVTLGMMLMASGLAFRLSEGASIPDLPTSFFWLGGGDTLGIPNPVWLMIILYIVAHIVMTQTAFGRYVYAIGGNEEAARLSGVPVKRVLLIVYTISGALAGLGGIILASKLEAGDPKFGLMYELEVIAAVVVGGTSLLGGSGRIIGTLIGAFILAVIKNGMNLTSVDPFNQKIVLGAVLLLAVLIDTLKRRVPLG